MKHPNCKRNPTLCRIQIVNQTTTLMNYCITYDGNGKRIEADPNVHVITYNCLVCHERWTEETQYGLTTIRI